MRDRYVELALPYIPRLLHLIDRNQYSRTYGSFDRAFWHYRTMDFPCGMSQEFVLPFAQVFANNYPGNRFYQQERMRELSVAAIRYMIPSSHRDGTCDDYFPFERAMGALVFSLYAASEAYQIVGMNDPQVVELFVKRCVHLSKENETGQLSNHQALAALAAYNVFKITGDDRWRRLAEERVELTLSWQNQDEGWFQEYEGADPGYHTCTIDFLAKLQQKRGDDALTKPLVKAVEFAWNFMHPDGGYGGEYGSRNTYHFYPHGFELMAPHTEKAGQIADAFLRAVPNDKRYHNDDDRMTAHYVYNFLQSYEDYHEPRPTPINEARRDTQTRWLPGAKMALHRTPAADGRIGCYAIANLSKGGVVKVFDEDGAIASDTGLIGELEDGKIVVTHLVQYENRIAPDAEAGKFSVEGVFCKRKNNLPTPFKVIIFRILLLTIGRFNANLTRSLLQRILITGKPTTEHRFKRTVEFDQTRVHVTDWFPADMPLKRLSVGSDATSIYVANSMVYQDSVLCPWQHAAIDQLPIEDGWRVWRRTYERAPRSKSEDAPACEVQLTS